MIKAAARQRLAA